MKCVGVGVFHGFQLLTLADVSVLEYAKMSLGEALCTHDLLCEHGGAVESCAGSGAVVHFCLIIRTFPRMA
jgi:hypothetical protein